MRVRMKSTQRGARDGVAVETFHSGREYDLAGSARSLDLARVFLREGWAEEVGAEPVTPPKVEVSQPPLEPAVISDAAPTPPDAPKSRTGRTRR